MANDLLHTTAEQLVTNLAIRDLVSGQTKSASDTEPSYAFSGQLYATDSGWIMLSVPNALVRGAFSAMTEPGLELPFNKEGKLNAHISVFRPEELEEVGGIEKVTERGKTFRYSVGRFVSTVPAGWSSMARVWFFTVHSPELQALRRSYGLSSLPNKGDFDFHVTVAVRRRGVLGRNTTKKSCEECADESFAPPTSVRQKVAALTPDQVKERFTPDLGVKELQSRGVYSRMYGSDPKARLASMLDWPKEWFTDNDPRGWLDWYEKYQDGRRDEDDDRQMRRWSSFKARHGAQFKRNPTPRRAYALQNWAIDPASMVADEQKDRVRTDMESYAVAKDAKRLKIASKRFTVCVDFDGTLAEQEKPFRIGSAGPPRKKNVALVNELHKEGVRIVVWTVRNNVKFLRKYLKDNKIEYDYINENPDQPPNGSKKLIADIYLDDRGVDARDEGKAEKEVMARFKAWKEAK